MADRVKNSQEKTNEFLKLNDIEINKFISQIDNIFTNDQPKIELIREAWHDWNVEICEIASRCSNRMLKANAEIRASIVAFECGAEKEGHELINLSVSQQNTSESYEIALFAFRLIKAFLKSIPENRTHSSAIKTHNHTLPMLIDYELLVRTKLNSTDLLSAYHLNISWIYIIQKRYKESLDLFDLHEAEIRQRKIKEDSNYPAIYYNMCHASWLNGDVKAIDKYLKGIKYSRPMEAAEICDFIIFIELELSSIENVRSLMDAIGIRDEFENELIRVEEEGKKPASYLRK